MYSSCVELASEWINWNMCNVLNLTQTFLKRAIYVRNQGSTLLEYYPRCPDDSTREKHGSKATFHKVRSLFCRRKTSLHKLDDVRQALQTSSKW